MIGNTNGFALMGVKPEDNLAMINARLTALSQQGINCQDVYQRLIVPDQRLKEEVRYFTGDITIPTKLDLPWHVLNNLDHAKDAASFAKGYKMLMDDLQDIDYDALVEAVNENRGKSGFPAVSLEEVEGACAGMDQEVGQYLVAMAQKRGIAFYAEVVNSLMTMGLKASNVFINAFPEYAKAFCQVQNGRINTLLTSLEQPDFNKIEDLDNILALRTTVLGTLKQVNPAALQEIKSYYSEIMTLAQRLINNKELIFGRALLEGLQCLYGEVNLIPADQAEDLITKIEKIELIIQEQLDAAEESGVIEANNEVPVDASENQVNESNEITAKTMAGVKELAGKMPSMAEISKTANEVKNDTVEEATKVAGTVAAATTVAAGTLSAAASSGAATATATVASATAKATEEVAKLSTKLASKELEQVEIPKATTGIKEEEVVEQAAPEPVVKVEPNLDIKDTVTAKASSPENTAETLDATTVMPELAAKIEEIEGKNSEPQVIIPSAAAVQEQVSKENTSSPGVVAPKEVSAKAEGAPKKKSKTPFIVAAAVAAILIGGGAGYYVISDNKPAAPVVEEQKPKAEEPAKEEIKYHGDAKAARTDFSVGGLSLGDNKDKLQEIFGGAKDRVVKGDNYQYQYHNFAVNTDDKDRVVGLEVGGPGYMTKKGLYVGMNIKEALALYGDKFQTNGSLYTAQFKDGEIPVNMQIKEAEGKVSSYSFNIDEQALKAQEEAKKKAEEEAKAKQQAQQQPQQQVAPKSGGGSAGNHVDVNGAIAAVRNHFGGKAGNFRVVSSRPDFVEVQFTITKRVSRGYGKFDNQVIRQTAGVAKRGGGWSISYVQ